MTPLFVRKERERHHVEEPAIKFARKRGWHHLKITSPSKNGYPDDLFIRQGRHVWWEFKAPGKEPSEQQYKRIRELKEVGAEVYWTDSLAAFEKVMM